MKYQERIKILKNYFNKFSKEEKEKAIRLLMNFENYEFVTNYNYINTLILIINHIDNTVYEFREYLNLI
jgi:hypothetical protein